MYVFSNEFFPRHNCIVLWNISLQIKKPYKLTNFPSQIGYDSFYWGNNFRGENTNVPCSKYYIKISWGNIDNSNIYLPSINIMYIQLRNMAESLHFMSLNKNQSNKKIILVRGYFCDLDVVVNPTIFL